MTKPKLTEGPIGKQLFKLGVPMFIAMNSFVAFNFFDTEFIGELGMEQLAAVSYTPLVVLVLFSLAFGLGTGVASSVGKAYGENDFLQVQKLTSYGLLLGVFISLIITFAGLPSIHPLFTFFGATENLLVYIDEFMVIWYWGVPLIIVPMMGNSAIRGMGNTMIPAIIMVSSIVANILLDYGFIFGNWGFPRWEVFGASFATFLARLVALFSGVLFLHYKFNLLNFRQFSIKAMLTAWREILKVGLPAFSAHLIIPISVIFLTKLASSLPNKDQLVATLQTSAKVDFIPLSVLTALGAVLVPFVAQNFGAGRFDRVREVIKISNRFAIIWGAVMTVLFLATNNFWGSIFQEDQLFQKYMAEFYLIVPFGFIFRMLFVVATNSMNAYQKPMYSAVLTLMEMLLIYVPMAYLFSYLWGYEGIFYAFLFANIIGGTAAYFVEQWLFKKITLLKQSAPSVS